MNHEPTVLQATAARLSTPCVTRTYAAVLVAVATVIPRISLTEPVGEHLIRRYLSRRSASSGSVRGLG